MAQKVEEAADLIFRLLIEQEPGIYDKCHADCSTRDKTGFAWERISHETKKPGSSLSSLETTQAHELTGIALLNLTAICEPTV
jgi:hypothetical protein